MARRIKGTVVKGLLLVAGLLVGHSTASIGQQFIPPTYEDDPRFLILKTFFEKNQAPAAELAEEFLIAADRYGLDWRLLPSIAFVETGGGKACENNNLFGWDSGRISFATPQEGIYFVASHLADSSLYRNKDLGELLLVYNPFSYYPRLVMSIMTRLSPNRLPARAPTVRVAYSSIRTPR